MSINCPICKSIRTAKHNILSDDRYAYPGVFSSWRCVDCGHIFLNEQFTADQLSDLYCNYYPRALFSVNDYVPHREQKGLLAWFRGIKSSAYRWVPKKVRILDIGCGFGETLGYHQARGCEVYGVEADTNIQAVIDKFAFNVQLGLFDAKHYPPGYFDYVTMDQVIEHVQQPSRVLRDIAQILKPGGRAILSTPNAQGWGAFFFARHWINWHAPYHLHFFSIKSMRIEAERAGLILENTRTITNSDWLGFQWAHLCWYPQPGQRSYFWTPRTQPRNQKEKAICKFLGLVRFSGINYLLTRVFDLFGMGDNRLFFLRKPG